MNSLFAASYENFKPVSKKDNYVKKGKDIFIGSRKLNEAANQAERLLIRLMCEINN